MHQMENSKCFEPHCALLNESPIPSYFPAYLSFLRSPEMVHSDMPIPFETELSVNATCCSYRSPTVNLSLTVSSKAPYKIVNVSRDLCTMLDFSKNQLQGRKLCTLCGPESEASRCVESRIAFAIGKIAENIELRTLTVKDVRIYSKDGTAHHVKLRCGPSSKLIDDSVRCCSLLFQPLG